jgi:competence protein ComEA
MAYMRKLGFALLPLLLVPVLSAQDVPDGPGKDTLNKVCTTCHDLGVLQSMTGTAEIWQSVADDMKSRGADGTDADFKAIIEYLSKYFGPPVKINTDPAKDIQALGLTSAEADAIVKYRADKGPFKEWADLMKVPGVDTAKLAGLQKRVKF